MPLYFYNERSENMTDLRDLAYKIQYLIDDKGIGEAEQGADDLAKRINGAGDNTTKLNKNAKETGNIFGGIAKVAATAFTVDKVKDMGTAIVNVSKDFEQSMANVQAVMMPTEQEFGVLEAAARKAGDNTKFSAKESADALYFLGSAGYNATESAKGLEGVLALAAAGNMGIADAADIATTSMKAMSLQTSDLTMFNDTLAMTARKTNSNISQLGEGILEVGGVATSAGLNVKDTATWLGILADKGMKASEGGTALRNVLLNLTAPNAQNAELLKDMGVKLTDTTGKFLPFEKILKNLDGTLGNYTEAQQQAIKEQIAGKENIQALNVLLQDSDGRYDSLRQQIENSSGAAQTQADILQNTLGGAMEELSSNMEGVALDIVKTTDLNGKMRDVIEDLKKQMPLLKYAGVTAFNALFGSIGFAKDRTDELAFAVGTLTTYLVINKGATMAATAWQATFGATIGTTTLAAELAGAVQVGYAIAMETGSAATGIAATAQLAFNAAMAANPIGVVVVALGALGYALYQGYKHFDDIKNGAVNLWNAINDNPIGAFILQMGPVTGTIKLITDHFGELVGILKTAWELMGKVFASDKKVQTITSGDRVFTGGSGIRQYATGTDSTPNSFVAGEKGAELITNLPDHKVYNASETQRILGGGGGKNVSMVNHLNIVVNGGDENSARKIREEIENFFGDLQVQMG